MRTLALSLLLFSVAGAASAQSVPEWAGPYAGVAFTAQSESQGETKAVIEPARDSRLTYTALPSGRSYEAGSFEDETSLKIFAGWRLHAAGWLIGAEVQLQEGGPAVRFDSGFNAQNFPAVPQPACGVPDLGCLQASFDGVAANVEVERIASLRLSAGVPLSDRVLVSAYAGPAVAFGRLEMTQTSLRFTQRPFRPGECSRFCVGGVTTSVVNEILSRTEDDAALGVVAGLTADFAVTERIMVRADVGYSRFEALRGSTGGANGGDSEVRSQLAGLAFGLGFGVRF